MIWEDPPQQNKHSPGRHMSWLNEATTLRGHPGQWGVIRQCSVKKRRQAYQLQSAVRNGRLRAFAPARSFDATVRTDGDVVKVYARYVGGTSPEGS